MGEARLASWYDRVYEESEKYRGAPEECPWLPVWEAVTDLVPEGSCAVVDLGCGPGHLAEMLLRDEDRSVLGIDFSAVAILRARKRCGRFGDRARFFQADLRSCAMPAGGDVYTFCEVLEHLTDDLGVLERVPTGGRVILSVPDKDSASHVRFFRDGAAAVRRYASVFAGDPELRTVDGPARWFVLAGTRA